MPDGLYLADILGGQRVADGHLADNVLHRHVQPRALPVVGREDEIHPSLGQQVLHAGPVAALVHGDGLPAVGPHHLHTRHVGEPVAHIDHVGKGHPLAVVGHGVVQRLVIGHVQHTLVDAVDELGLVGEVDVQLGPAGGTRLVIVELAGVDLLELVGNAAALNDLLQPGGQHIVLDGHALLLTEGVDPLKPLPYAGKQLHAAAARHQKVPLQVLSLGAALGDHGVHIRQQPVHPVLTAEGVGLVPELRRGVSQGRDKGVVLHVRGTQRLVKVVQQRDDGLCHIGPSVEKRRRKAAFFCCAYLFPL